MTRLFALLTPCLALAWAIAGCSASSPICARGPGGIALLHAPRDVEAHVRRENRPVNLDYKLTRADASETVLLAGQSDLDLGRSAVIERQVSNDSARLRLTAEPGDGGKILVSVEWDERSNEGQRLRWSPTLSMGEGGTATATLDLGGGDGRKIAVTLQPPTHQPEAPTPPKVSLQP